MGVIATLRIAAVGIGLVLSACTGRTPPPPAAEPANGEPGAPPATPVVPVQSQPLGAPGN